MPLSLRFCAISDVGRRKKNDDSGYAGSHFLMVADGMGGAPHGDLASAVAVQTMQRLDVPPPEDLLEALAGSVHRANDRLAEMIEEDSGTDGMGTTVTAVLFDGERIAVAHLGDSRGYLWRDGELLRITHDHSWVQSLIDEDRITEEEAAVHSHRSLLLKVLDGRHDNDPDLASYDVQAGDRVLLCSDGLSSFVDHERMAQAMSIGSADAVAAELVQLALDSPSNDNITVVVADVVDDAPAADPIVVGAAAASPRVARGRIRSWAHRDTNAAPGEALVDADVDPEELRYAPREPRRFGLARRLALIAAVLGLLTAGGIISYNWTQSQYFVAEADGRVAIYRGVQADLPGAELHRVFVQTDLDLDELPSFWRSQVAEGLAADSLQDAKGIVGRLEGFARDCATAEPTASTKSSKDSPSTNSGGGQQGTASKTESGAGKTRSPDPKTTRTTRKPRTDETSASAAAESESTAPDGAGQEDDCSGATPSPETSP